MFCKMSPNQNRFRKIYFANWLHEELSLRIFHSFACFFSRWHILPLFVSVCLSCSLFRSSTFLLTLPHSLFYSFHLDWYLSFILSSSLFLFILHLFFIVRIFLVRYFWFVFFFVNSCSFVFSHVFRTRFCRPFVLELSFLVDPPFSFVFFCCSFSLVYF